MMRYGVAGLLLALSWPGVAEQPSAGTGAIPKPAPQSAAEAIRENTAEVRAPAGAQKPDVASPAEHKPALSEPAKRLENERPITDPTQMTGSFSQALKRVTGNAGTSTRNGGTLAAPIFPEISLAAKAIGRSRDKAAMLSVAGKNRMIKEGGRFSFQQDKTLYEIRVDKIERDQVLVTVLPMGKQMILE